MASAAQQSAAGGVAEIPDTTTGEVVTSDSADTLLAGVAVSADPQAGVDVVDQGDVEGTICDCGEITVPGGGFPKWPLLFLAAIPFFFIHGCDHCETPTPPTTPTPPGTPEIPEPASLLLFGSGLAAFGAGLRRRYARGKLETQLQNYGGGLIKMSKATFSRRRAYGKFAFAALLALTFCMAHPASTAYAKKRKLAKYGSIKILSTPGGLPIEIDGKPEGQTTTDYRSFDRDPGLHTVVITLPNGQRWTREIDLEAGRIKCVAINFRSSPPTVKSPCPYPVSLSVDAEVNEGDVITFSADTAYSGNALLNYTWSVSPASAKMLTSVGNKITVDSTGLGGQRVTATLVVDDGSGEPVCRQTAQASAFVRPPERHESILRGSLTYAAVARLTIKKLGSTILP